MNRGVLVAGVLAVLALSVSLDLISISGLPLTGGEVAAFTLGGLATVLFLGSNRLSTLARRVAATLLAAASLTLTAILHLPTVRAATVTWGLFETVAFVCVLGSISRKASRGDALPLAALFAAIAIAPTRMSDIDAITGMILVTVVSVSVLAFGLLRRTAEVRAAQITLSVRNDERRAMARDLHDDIAHHVTGIIVMAQAADHVFDLDRDAAREAIKSIERSAIQTLKSMRSAVVILRTDEDSDVDPQLVVASKDSPLFDIVDDFTRATQIPTSLRLACSEIPVSHEQAMLRIIQEALTNVRRHALDPTQVEVEVTQDGAGFRLTVTDDGRKKAGLHDTHRRGVGGGFGLVGLDERTAAFGGTLTAGPTDPQGWRIEATLPWQRPRALR